jgi:hypothetical protein
MAKLRISKQLGEKALLLPELVNRGLVANDQVKYLLTLLQAARQHADRPDGVAVDLGAERLLCGLDDRALDDVPVLSRRREDGYRIPRAAELRARVLDLVGGMIAPLDAAADGAADGAAPYASRLRDLRARVEAEGAGGEEDAMSAAQLDLLTHADRARGDSAHLLVMDLHKELNALQRELAEESVAGARVYGLGDDDRRLVAAFMDGVGRTAPLKLDHPGLDCTATRSGRALVIQNDIGETDAHVLVVHVEGLTVSITYTDVHPARARFFTDLFAARDVAWKGTERRTAEGFETGGFLLCVGVHRAADRDALERFLAFLGSRLVFLIDWNKARKALRKFVSKAEAVEILAWAAAEEVGQRAFLELGGERLVYDAVEKAGRSSVPYGRELSELLGREPTREFLKFVLRTAAAGLLEGRSHALIRDEVRAELSNRFGTALDDLLAILGDHAGWVVQLAAAVRDGLIQGSGPGGADLVRATAQRAAGWERAADDLVNRAREIVRRSVRAEYEVFRRLLERGDDAADCLEEAGFLLTLRPEGGRPELVAAGQRLAGLALEGAQEWVRAVEAASWLYHGGQRQDVQDFLRAVDRLVTIEHVTDEAERDVTAQVVRETDAASIYLQARIAASVEESIDALRDCAIQLRRHALESVGQS